MGLPANVAPPGFANFRYAERGIDDNAIKVLPGEFYVDSRNTAIITLLGSCVAACLRDPVAGIGGMNHFLLPDSIDDSSAHCGGRYGIHAMEMLINEMVKRGAQRQRLEAKVFGGGQVMKSFAATNVGERNAKFVRDFLHLENIAILSEDLLGTCPRKVCFFPKSGRALVKRLATVDNYLIEEEKRYRRHLVEVPASGDVELF